MALLPYFIPAMVDLFVLEHAPEAFYKGCHSNSLSDSWRPSPRTCQATRYIPGCNTGCPDPRVVNQNRCGGSLGGYGPQKGLADQIWSYPAFVDCFCLIMQAGICAECHPKSVVATATRIRYLTTASGYTLLNNKCSKIKHHSVI